jgi:hypothetical protein
MRPVSHCPPWELSAVVTSFKESVYGRDFTYCREVAVTV